MNIGTVKVGTYLHIDLSTAKHKYTINLKEGVSGMTFHTAMDAKNIILIYVP